MKIACHEIRNGIVCPEVKGKTAYEIWIDCSCEVRNKIACHKISN